VSRMKRPRGAPRWVQVCSTAAVLTLATTACTHARGSSPPSMTLQMSRGSATISGGGRTQKVTGEAAIGVGYHVTVDPNSLAVLRLGSGRTFELTEGEASITGVDRIQLAKGAALGDLTANGQIETGGLTVSSASGTFRVTSGAMAGVGVFSGLVSMSVPGAALSVPAFREAATASGVPATAPRPLEILAGGDVWDHRYLGDAIDLDARLASFGGGLDAQLGNATGRDFFRLVIADPMNLAHVEPYLSRPRSDVLVGLVLAAATSRPDPPQATFDQIMGLWLAGESWGLLAMEYHVPAQQVFAGLLAAIRKVGITVTNPTPGVVPIPVTTRPPAVATGTPKSSATPAPLPPSATPTPSSTGTLNQVLDPVTTLLNNILNLLLPPSPTPTPGATPGAKG
jgi:hypothetical protein